jgi:lipopolysaccharide transport system permease protein
VEAFRFGFLGAGTLDPWNLLYSLVFMLVTLLAGVLLYNHVEATFMDTI